MSSPKTVKEVQRLTSCLAALGRFLSRAGYKCHYFFRAIRKKSKFEWSDEAEEAFLKLKDHFHTLLRLVSPLQGEVLCMYMAVSEYSLSAVLLTEREGSPEGDSFEYAMRFNFQASNNEAEYEAFLCSIKMCKAAGAKEILALFDSQLIVSQVNGNYETRDPTMIKYMKVVHQEVEKWKSFEVRQVPRSENNQADALSKLASSASGDTPRYVFWEVKDQKIIEQLEAAVLDRMSTWMDNIINFKMNGVLPDDPKQAAKLQKKCSWFEMWNGTLYKAYSRPLLRCVTPEKGQEILQDIHQGWCSSNIGGRALAVNALQTGYYWPTLKDDALSLRCNKCQRFTHLIHRTAQIVTPITSPIPFAKRGMDLIGPYTTAPGGRRYVIVVVDYFTKWVEAEALKNIPKAFIWKNIITRFGVPQLIIFDNGPQFETPKLKDWLAERGIAGHFASVGRPQANGQVEAFNKIISEGMKKKLDEAKGL
ncbi:uncharacterized protein [Spinacia oleracea]|uniref:Integrase catalytic domain-containing protein n=1 Tax=Spinacia oleracea TaxID=3562 RepID=A0ABM3R335_SPIOL|nr:uncharacterized protein LOC130464837 [Spinacia oleracea]